MAAEVKILIEGYTNADVVAEVGEEITCPTITLVKDGDLNMIVDPGVLESQQVLLDILEKEGLKPDDIDVVAITHSHIDHYRNIGMFPRAKVLEYFGLWSNLLVEDWPQQFSPYIQVLKTPGHDYTSITLFVTTDDGVVAICGDVFWRENSPKDTHDDLYASDYKELEKSREMILKKADWIIPGHGPMFKIDKGFVETIKEVISLNGKKNHKEILCKKCKRLMGEKENCVCRPWLCFRCCECGLDCSVCGCSHKQMHKRRW